MSDQETPIPAAPKAKRKYHRRKQVAVRRTVEPKTASAKNEFAGISMTECCAGCGNGHCTIIGNGFCGHPYKASHPLATPEQNAKIEQARKIIARQIADA